MAFNPWHGIAAHRPMGGVMRVRKAAYAFSKALRAGRDALAIREPRDLAVPDGLGGAARRHGDPARAGLR